MNPYPQAKKIDHGETRFGIRIKDPYRWMENENDADLRSWIAAQKKFAQSFLEAVPARESIRKRLRELFDYPKYNQKAPWASALTQSVGMNALAARAGMDRDLQTLTIAEKMLNSLKPGKGGLAFALSDSSTWFMEYPADEPYYSLSVMMSTLLHLHKYYELTRNPLAMELFEAGFSALKSKLPEFDYHGYSYYNLAGDKAGRMYHKRHIMLLRKLMELKQDPVWRPYRPRWTRAHS